jgi:hypothetical protein
MDAQPATHVKAQAGTPAHEARQHLGEAIGGEVLRHAEPHHAVARRARDHVARFLGERENPPRIGEQPLALLRCGDPLAVTMQQRSAEHFFQPPDLLAHGGLGAMNALAGAGEAAGIDDGNEAAQQVDIEHGTSHSYFH